MTNDRSLFNTTGQGLPLYEGKMIHQFDAYFTQPQYWVNSQQTSERLKSKNRSGQHFRANRLSIRAIARSTDELTLIASLLPANAFCGNSLIVVREGMLSATDKLYLLSLLNSLILRTRDDACARSVHCLTKPIRL
jgi:hypothetical protein